MPFSFRLYEPAADVAFISVVDGEALFNCDDKVGHDAREATLQQIGWHPIRFPEDWFLGERHQDTANHVLETMQCTIQYLHHCQRKAEKELRKATKTLTRYQEERDDAFEEVVTLRETVALYKKRVSVAERGGAGPSASSPPGRRQNGGGDEDARRTQGLLCSLCGNEYPSVHSLESHIKKRHKRTEDFATLAATSAGVARRTQESRASPWGPPRAAADSDQPPSRLSENLSAEVSALRFQVAKLMGEAADQRQAFSPVHLVGMPLGTLPGQSSPLADNVVRRNQSAANEATAESLRLMTESLQNATAKMAAMEKALAALQQGSQVRSAAPGPTDTPREGSSSSSKHSATGVLGALPSAVLIGKTAAAPPAAAGENPRRLSLKALVLSPNSLAQQRRSSAATPDWDVDVSPMTQVDPTPRGSRGTRPSSAHASRTSADDRHQLHGSMNPPRSASSILRTAGGPAAVSSVSSSRDEASTVRDSQTMRMTLGGAVPPLTTSSSPQQDSVVAIDADHSDVVLTARRPASLSGQTTMAAAPPLPLPVPSEPRDRYTLVPGDALSTSVTPREPMTGRRRSSDMDESSTAGESRQLDNAGGGGSAVASRAEGQPGPTTQLPPPLPGAPTAPDMTPDHSRETAAHDDAANNGDDDDQHLDASQHSHIEDANSSFLAPALNLSPYSIPSLATGGSLLQATPDHPKSHALPKVELVSDQRGEASRTVSSSPTSSSAEPTPVQPPPLPPPLSLNDTNMTAYVDSLPQSTVKRKVSGESPLGWTSSNEVSPDHTPMPALGNVTPLQPPYLPSGERLDSLPASQVSRTQLLEGGLRPARVNTDDDTSERQRPQNQSDDASRPRAESASYSYYYTYSSTPSDAAKSGGEHSASRLSPASRAGDDADDGEGEIHTPSTIRRRPKRGSASSRKKKQTSESATPAPPDPTLALRQPEIITAEVTVLPPPPEESRNKAKNVFKSLFGKKKKKGSES